MRDQSDEEKVSHALKIEEESQKIFSISLIENKSFQLAGSRARPSVATSAMLWWNFTIACPTAMSTLIWISSDGFENLIKALLSL